MSPRKRVKNKKVCCKKCPKWKKCGLREVTEEILGYSFCCRACPSFKKCFR